MARDGLEAKLRSGARVADLGCGRGALTVLLAQAYPASTVHGFDPDAEAVVAGRRAAAIAGVSDRVTFEVAPLDDFPGFDYDLVRLFHVFDATSDLTRMARRVRAALAPDGAWQLVGPSTDDRAGEAALRQAATEAGFARVRRASDSPFDLVAEAHS